MLGESMTGRTADICFACGRSTYCMEFLVTGMNIFVRVLTVLSRLGCRKLLAQSLELVLQAALN